MARVTIYLPDELHRALKAAAARRGSTIGSLVAENVDFLRHQERRRGRRPGCSGPPVRSHV